MSILNFLPLRRRLRPPDADLPPSGRPITRRELLPQVTNITRLHLLMLLFSRP